MFGPLLLQPAGSAVNGTGSPKFTCSKDVAAVGVDRVYAVALGRDIDDLAGAVAAHLLAAQYERLRIDLIVERGGFQQSETGAAGRSKA